MVDIIESCATVPFLHVDSGSDARVVKQAFHIDRSIDRFRYERMLTVSAYHNGVCTMAAAAPAVLSKLPYYFGSALAASSLCSVRSA